MNKQIAKIKPKLVKILKANGVKKAGIFGSYARGEQKKGSDIDILIEIPKNRKFSLLDLAGLEIKLEESLGIKVQIVTYDSVYHLIKNRILKEEKRII